jgi:hypothetical protein
MTDGRGEVVGAGAECSPASRGPAADGALPRGGALRPRPHNLLPTGRGVVRAVRTHAEWGLVLVLLLRVAVRRLGSRLARRVQAPEPPPPPPRPYCSSLR